MSKAERAAWAEARTRPWKSPPDSVEPTSLRTRRAYIEFATQAALFARTPKVVRFTGKHWKL